MNRWWSKVGKWWVHGRGSFGIAFITFEYLLISIALAEKIVGKSSFFGDTKAFARLVYYLYVVSVFIFLFSFWSNLSSHFQYHHLKTHHHHNHHHEQRRHHHHHHHHYRHHYHHHHHQHHLHHWLFENVVPLFSFFLCTIFTFLVIFFFSACEPNPCQHGGTCYEESNAEGYRCECTQEYEGMKCECK